MKVFMQEAGPLTATDVVIGAGELWSPYRELHSIIHEAITRPCPPTIEELDAALRRHKTDIVNLFKLRPRSAVDREELKKAGSEGLSVRGQEGKQILSASIITESILLSDMFDINEFHALDLLVTAANELENYPGWGRGILAVYFFYEGRSMLIQSILAMLEIVSGSTWSSRANPKVTELCVKMLDSFFAQDDMMDQLIKILDKSLVKSQIEILETNLALGDWRHRSQVFKFVNDIRLGMANIIFCWSAQRGLSWKNTQRILEYLKIRMVQREEFKMTKDDVFLIEAILYAIDGSISINGLNKEFIFEIKRYCQEQEFAKSFEFDEIIELIRLTYYTDIFKLTSFIRINPNTSIYDHSDPASLLKDEDEYKFKKDIFGFLKRYIFSDPTLFAPEEHLMRRWHKLFTDFIQHIPMKLKDMKNRAEDGAKTAFIFQEQGLALPANLPQDYENFLECIGLFYAQDTYELAEDYFSNDIQYASLNKLIRTTSVDPPTMFMHNVKMLSGLAVSCPSGVFNFINQNGHNVSLEHFFESLGKYLASFGNQEPNTDGPNHQQQSQFSSPAQILGDQQHKLSASGIKYVVNPNEIKGICYYLDVVEVLSKNCPPAREYFTTTKSHWLRILLRAVKFWHLPRDIRAKALRTAASMISTDYHSPEIVTGLWNMLYSEKLIDDQTQNDLRLELIEVETKLESYTITISLLHLIDALVEGRFKRMEEAQLDYEINFNIDQGAFQPYLSFIIESVLLKAAFRSYKLIRERWEMITIAIGIISKLLDFIPSIIVQMLSDSPLLQTILNVIVECTRVKELSLTPNPYIDKCSWESLNIIHRVLKRQAAVFCKKDSIAEKKGKILIGVHEIILKLSPVGKPDFLKAILKFIDVYTPEPSRQLALEILSMILKGHSETDNKIYRVISTEPALADILKHTFISILYDVSTTEECKGVILQIIRSSIVHEPPNFAMFALCVEKRKDFQNPGVNNYPKTILHAILDRCFSLPDSFLTLLTLIGNHFINKPLLRYLRTNQIFVKFLHEDLQLNSMSPESIGYFLKCMAIELRTAPTAGGPLARTLISSNNFKFSEILEKINFDNYENELPKLEFFDLSKVIETMQKCEYFNKDLANKLIHVDMLESVLRSEIAKLEKSTTLKLRKSVHIEANELLTYADKVNQVRILNSTKILLFDGWRQCLETLCLTSIPEKLIGSDFITSTIRLLLEKVLESQTASENFLRLCSETVMILTAVMCTFQDLSNEISIPTLHIILKSVCTWVARERSYGVRAQLYASLLYVVKFIKGSSPLYSHDFGYNFNSILEQLCKDAVHAPEMGRIIAMHLLGEDVYWCSGRGLGGCDYALGDPRSRTSLDKSFSRVSQSSMMNESPSKMDIFMNESRILNDTTNQQAQGSGSIMATSYYPDRTQLKKDGLSTPTAAGYSPVGKRELQGLSKDSSVLKYMNSKGFLSSIVDELPTNDNSLLIGYFTSSPLSSASNAQALLLFEAKLTMLTRFANCGPKAATSLVNVNAIDRLIDMTVFELTYFQEAENSLLKDVQFMRDFSNPSETSSATILSRMDLLFSGPLMFFHAMLNSNPRNLFILEKIVNFLTSHDLVLSNLLSETILRYTDVSFHSSNLLLALLARLALSLPPQAFERRTWIFIQLVKILKNQIDDKIFTDYRLRIVRSTMQFFLNHSKGVEITEPSLSTTSFSGGLKEKQRRRWTCRPLLSPKITLTPDIAPDNEEISIGIVLKIVMDMANHLSTTSPATSKKFNDILAILEMGLTLVYFHSEIYLSKTYPMSVPLDPLIQTEFRLKLSDFLQGISFKTIFEIVKDIQGAEYVIMVLHRLRRLANLPEEF